MFAKDNKERMAAVLAVHKINKKIVNLYLKRSLHYKTLINTYNDKSIFLNKLDFNYQLLRVS